MAQLSLLQARGLVAPPTGQVRVTHQDGMTAEIISEVRAVSRESAGQTARLAEQLRGATPKESAANVFRFVRKNIRYKLDPNGKQLIKTPAAVIGTGFCDCKGYATLTNDLLRCLGIPCAFRFVSFSRLRHNITHVYSLAWPVAGGKPYVLDACLPGFNQEKAFTFHQDYMTEISRVSGIGRRLSNPGRARTVRRHHRETPLNISGFETEEEMTLKLMRQGAEVERNTAAAVQGIGSTAVGKHQAAVNDYTEALNALQGGEGAINGLLTKLHGRRARLRSPLQAQARSLNKLVRGKRSGWMKRSVQQVSGPLRAPRASREERRIGFLKKLLKKAKTVAKKVVKTTAKVATKAAKATGKAVATGAKVVAKTAVKAGKLALKVVTAPMRLVAKGILEIFLPKMAPMFIYMFITNQSTIASLPAAAARKRRKALSFAKFITKTIGMKEAHFLKIVRTGIQRQMGGTPEQVLAKSVKGPISGIGFAPLAALVPMVLDMIKKIAGAFGKKPTADEQPTASDMPDLAADFADASAKVVRKVVTHAATKPASQRGEEPDTYANEMAQEAEEAATQTAVDNEPEETPVDAPLPEPEYAPEEEPATDYAEAPADEEELVAEEEVSGIWGNYL